MGEQNQMDALAYTSRMISWAPLGKLFFAISLLIVDLVTHSFIVPIVALIIGLILMAYSTNMRIPLIIGIMIAESILIMILGAAMIMILPMAGDTSTILWTWTPLGLNFEITHDSFNYGIQIFMRAIAGVTLMLSFATSTPIPHLAQSLHQLRVPPEVIEIIVLIYRYTFLLMEQLIVMWHAAHCKLGFSSYKRSFKTTASIMVNMFIRSWEIADRSDAALQSRNFNGVFPVYRKPGQLNFRWCVIIIGFAIMMYVLGLYTEDWVDIAELIFT